MGLFDRLFRRKPKQPVPATPPSSPAEIPWPKDTPLPEWASFFSTAERFERFDALVRGHFRESGRRALIIDGILRVTSAPGGKPTPEAADQQFGLGNLAQTCALEPEAEWPAIIRKHFTTVERLMETDRGEVLTFADARERLGIRLWDMTVEQVRMKSIWKEEIPGLASVLCLDQPEAIRSVRTEEAKEWGLSDEELIEAARQNLRHLAPVRHATHDLPEGHAIHEFMGESPFTASWATMVDELIEFDGPHGCFFAVPNRHRVMLMEFRGPETIKALSQFMFIATGLEREGPGSISPRVYWRRAGETFEIPYSIESNALNVSPPDAFVEYLNGLAESDPT